MSAGSPSGRYEAIRSRPVLLGTLRQGWSQHDPAVNDYLDKLALKAAEDAEALEWLLFLAADLRLARPALHQILIDGNDIETAEQTSLVAVASKIDQYQGSARFTTWLHRVATNEAKMLIRARSRRRDVTVEHLPVDDGSIRAVSSLVGSRDAVLRSLNNLAAHYRSVIVLRELGGYSYDEIARTLEISPGTVRSRLSRGRRMLLNDLGVDDTTPGAT